MERLRLILGVVVVVLALVLVLGLAVGDEDEDGTTTQPASGKLSEPSPREGAPPDAGSAPPETGKPSGHGNRKLKQEKTGGAKPAAGGDEERRDGGSGDEGSSEGVQVPRGGGTSKARFIERSDEICTKATRTVTERLQRMESKGVTLAPADLYSGVFVPALNTAARELGRLEPPSGDEKKAAAIAVALHDGIDELEAALRKGGQALNLALGPQSPLEPFSELAGEYGMKRCSRF